jgi:hypothetical protein
MDIIDQYIRAERSERSPCQLRVTLLKNGQFRAWLSFAPGMETAKGDGATVADAIARLERELTR